MKPKITIIGIDMSLEWDTPFVSICRGDNETENWRQYPNPKWTSAQRLFRAAMSIVKSRGLVEREEAHDV